MSSNVSHLLGRLLLCCRNIALQAVDVHKWRLNRHDRRERQRVGHRRLALPSRWVVDGSLRLNQAPFQVTSQTASKGHLSRQHRHSGQCLLPAMSILTKQQAVGTT